MATAKKTIKTETRVTDTPMIQLTLTLDEADALAKILLSVGGERALGREHADSILDALNPGVSTSRKFYTTGAIYFTSAEKARTY